MEKLIIVLKERVKDSESKKLLEKFGSSMQDLSTGNYSHTYLSIYLI